MKLFLLMLMSAFLIFACAGPDRATIDEGDYSDGDSDSDSDGDSDDESCRYIDIVIAVDPSGSMAEELAQGAIVLF